MAGLDELAVQLGDIRTRLQEAGETGLVRSLSNAIGRAVEPLEREIRDGLAPKLPDRYAAVIDADLEVQRRTFSDPDGARVSVYARTRGEAKRKLRRLDDGVLWHPAWGDRKSWHEQQVTPGWFSRPCEDSAPRVRKGIIQALNNVTERAVHR